MVLCCVCASLASPGTCILHLPLSSCSSRSSFQRSMLFNHPPLRLSWTSTFRSIRKIPPVCTRLFSVSVSRYTVEMGTVNTSERLSKLRQLMQQHKVDVYSMTSYPWLVYACTGFVDTDCYEKLSRRKIATSRNTLRHAMLVEVRLSLLHFHFHSRSRAASGPHHSHLTLQSSFRDSRGLRVRPLCRRPRQLYRQMEDISTKPRNSWMTTGLS